jgi:hypothetical protein
LPITRMVAYAEAAQKVPSTAATIASDRSAGVTGGGGRRPLSRAQKADEPLGSSWWNRKAGLAMKRTPEKAIRPARASFSVKGSWVVIISVRRINVENAEAPGTYAKGDPAYESRQGRDKECDDG